MINSLKSYFSRIFSSIRLFPEVIRLNKLSRHAALEGKTRIIIYLSIPLHLNFIRDLLQDLTNDPKFFIMVACEFPLKNIMLPSEITIIRDKKIIGWIPANFLLTGDAEKPVSSYPGTKVVHIPHSLASMHVIYPEDAFDYFDVIFCAGPHHMNELSSILKKRRVTNCVLVPTGYELVDRQRRIPHISTKPPTIVFAPSWGPDNALTCHGEEIVSTLINEYNIVVRPHVMSIGMDTNVLTTLKEKYGTNPHFSLDTASDSQETLAKADLLISDWSGVAFEYALAYHRPVIFIDGPMKVFNNKWSEYSRTPGIESTFRKEIGVVLKNVSNLKTVTKSLLQESAEWEGYIRETKQKILYNPGECAKYSHIALTLMADGKKDSKWVQI